MISCCESELRTRTDTDYIFFGQWPQSLKSENVSITTKSDIINGKTYYLGSDGEYYAKVENAQPYYDKVIFSNSENVVAGNTYYFKLEPIKWRILTGKNTSNALIFAEQIIFCQALNKSSPVTDLTASKLPVLSSPNASPLYISAMILLMA